VVSYTKYGNFPYMEYLIKEGGKFMMVRVDYEILKKSTKHEGFVVFLSEELFLEIDGDKTLDFMKAKITSVLEGLEGGATCLCNLVSMNVFGD